jgi:hypothetical protein
MVTSWRFYREGDQKTFREGEDMDAEKEKAYTGVRERSSRQRKEQLQNPKVR